VGACWGHAMSKCCQYGIDDNKVSSRLIVSIKLLFLVVVGIWEQWMEQGCCCLPQTLNPKIGDDVT